MLWGRGDTGKVLLSLSSRSKIVFVFLCASGVEESPLRRGGILHILSCSWVFA